MSSLTRCNRCTLNDILRRYPTATIELRYEDGWTVCYVDSKRVASFLELPDRCAC